jgi:dipeptidyl aminopeptidase/acylaminoacyl peptidase
MPPPQSVELYRAPKANGVETRLQLTPREPHVWRKLRHELFKIHVELDGFEKPLRGSCEWAKPPGAGEEEKRSTDGMR